MQGETEAPGGTSCEESNRISREERAGNGLGSERAHFRAALLEKIINSRNSSSTQLCARQDLREKHGERITVVRGARDQKVTI